MSVSGLREGLELLEGPGFAIRKPEMPPIVSRACPSIVISGKRHTIDSVQQDIVDNPGSGSTLCSLGPRFVKYAWPSHEKFIDYFGPDMVPSLHGAYQALTIGEPILTNKIAKGYELTEDESSLFMLFMAMHDGHEGDIALLRNEKSDTPNEDKNTDYEFGEFTSNRNYVSAILGVRYDDPIFEVYDSFWGETEELNREEANRHHLVWYTTEHLGYLATGLQGVDISFRVDDNITPRERELSLALAADALRWNIPVLEKIQADVTYDFANKALKKAHAAVPLVAASLDISDIQFFEEKTASRVTGAIRTNCFDMLSSYQPS